MWITRLTLATVLAVGVLSFDAKTQELPPLPKLVLADFLPAIRRQVNDAYSTARGRPSDAAAVGKLGMVLDAYHQHDSAAACYDRARRLDPGAFSWAYYLGIVRLHQGKYGEAASTLRAALRLN